MLANFIIRVHDPVEAIAIPANGVVREADGTMTAWVTTDRRHFVQRVIKPGLRSEAGFRFSTACSRVNWWLPTAPYS